MTDPLRKEEKKEPTPDRHDPEPGRPDVSTPGRDNLLKRMKRVDPKQSERYKQRTGQ